MDTVDFPYKTKHNGSMSGAVLLFYHLSFVFVSQLCHPPTKLLVDLMHAGDQFLQIIDIIEHLSVAFFDLYTVVSLLLQDLRNLDFI